MAEAMKELGVTTKRDAVDKALREAVWIKRQLRAWDKMRGSGRVGDKQEIRGNRYTVEA
ncbi:MAG: type toxin-antitoxin system VapB family antitoxin [Sphingomonas bacterium]|nr:type toxin-antitoxin system VapB family antitoxin [Sphingomonas bacterium]